LTVVAHFRDVGLLPDKHAPNGENGAKHQVNRRVDTGDKVIYIAPMKALAQEVVDKFSQKLKPLHLIVRELTGDMQLTRSEAESANVIVTVRQNNEHDSHFIVTSTLIHWCRRLFFLFFYNFICPDTGKVGRGYTKGRDRREFSRESVWAFDYRRSSFVGR
jgi:hypothetical protein